MRRAAIFFCFFLLVGCGIARGQELQSQERRTSGEETTAVSAGQKSTTSELPRRAGIVEDNLAHVSATAEQILEIAGRDTGLMVELKRVIAQDAGESGQILEESDLTDSAVALRLQEDLRTRVLATRLLRMYGYLLPKVNPESDLAEEQKLVFQERAQELARAAERNHPTRERAQAELFSNCDTQQDSCELPQNGTQPTPTLSNVGRHSAVPAYPAAPQERPVIQQSQQELLSTQSEQTSQPEAFLLSASENIAGNGSALPNRGASGVPRESTSGTLSPNNGQIAAGQLMDATVSPNVTRASSRDVDRRHVDRAAMDGALANVEPVRMVHRPNPYADVPSLYDLYVQASVPTRQTERFGAEVFRRGAINPDVLPMDLPVGPDYVLGPGDSLSIDLWGGLSQRLFRTVDREGRLVLPEAGPLLVSGKSLGEVQQAVQHTLRTQFRDVSADVSLLKLRTVRVYVVGEVLAPGAYDVSSLSTPLNVLFTAGGVTSQGSLRRLEHYRGKQLIQEVDAYDLLLHGIRGDMKRLESGDSLRVPPIRTSVIVDGMVRRPAIYELRDEKNLDEVLDLAGGILPAAELSHIEVQRLTAHEKRSMLSLEIGETSDKDALRNAFEKFGVQDGDEIHIYPIAPYNAGAIYLEGHVLRPGRYSYREGMKLTDLITSYKDLLPEPSVRYAEIIRIEQPDSRPVVESFNLSDALAHPESAPRLQALDTVRIFGRYSLEDTPEFSVFGEVRHPGSYRSSGQAHVRDAIYQAGGTTLEAWEDSAQLFRSASDGSTRVFGISLREALAGDPLNNILVEPHDRILIHRQPERVNPPSVYVKGEVARPGRYPLTVNMRVSDLVSSAGGLLRSANPATADLTHYAASSTPTAAGVSQESNPVNLTGALAKRETEDLPLRDGDVLTVPQQTGWTNLGASVALHGEVAKPGVYGIQPGERLSSLLRRAGGLLPTAYPKAAVFERVEVREMQQKSRQELIQRLEQESTVVRSSVNTSGSDEAALQQAAIQQRQRILDALRRAPISGRLVVHIREGEKGFEGSPDDLELRAGDKLDIPKQPGFVVIVGQVYNSNAIAYSPGKNAGWYLSRAGGATSLANRKAIFIIRANGSVTSASSGMWSGGVLSATLGPGDAIVVPERTTVGGSALKNIVAVAQIAQAAALAAAVALP